MSGMVMGPAFPGGTSGPEGGDLTGGLPMNGVSPEGEATGETGASGEGNGSAEAPSFLHLLASALENPAPDEAAGEETPFAEGGEPDGEGEASSLVGTERRGTPREPAIFEFAPAGEDPEAHLRTSVPSDSFAVEPDGELLPPDPLLEGTIAARPRTPESGMRPSLEGTTPAAPTTTAADPLGESTLIRSEPTAPVDEAAAVRLEPDLTLLEPDFRARLERVVKRMRTEFGHNVKVIEGFRTPARQEALFAQGRTEPGPIVTWTRNSLHTEGLAVDVMVDGSFAHHEGYRRLAQLAEQEGLNSLWPRDPGHIEFKSEAQLATSPLPSTGTGQTGGSDRIARPAQVATVAEASIAAEVARPAEVALPGNDPVPMMRAPGAPDPTAQVAEGGPPPETSRPGAPDLSQIEPRLAEARPQDGRLAEPEVADISLDLAAPAVASEDTDRPVESRAERIVASALSARGSEAAVEAGLRSASTGALSAAAASGAAESGTSAGSMMVRSAASAAPESLHRISQIREIQELAYPRKLGQVTLRMMDGLGEEARMRVRLEADGVSTAIGVKDLGQAELLRTRIGALEQSLRLQGIEPLSVRVSALTSALETMDSSAWWNNDSGRGSDADLSDLYERNEDERNDPEGRRSDNHNEDARRGGREDQR